MELKTTISSSSDSMKSVSLDSSFKKENLIVEWEDKDGDISASIETVYLSANEPINTEVANGNPMLSKPLLAGSTVASLPKIRTTKMILYELHYFYFHKSLSWLTNWKLYYTSIMFVFWTTIAYIIGMSTCLSLYINFNGDRSYGGFLGLIIPCNLICFHMLLVHTWKGYFLYPPHERDRLSQISRNRQLEVEYRSIDGRCEVISNVPGYVENSQEFILHKIIIYLLYDTNISPNEFIKPQWKLFHLSMWIFYPLFIVFAMAGSVIIVFTTMTDDDCLQSLARATAYSFSTYGTLAISGIACMYLLLAFVKVSVVYHSLIMSWLRR